MKKSTVEDLFRQVRREHRLLTWLPAGGFGKSSITFFPSGFCLARTLSLSKSLALAGDGTPVYTAAQERKTRTCELSGKWDPWLQMQPQSIISLTVTLAGIPTVTVFTLDTTYTC